MKKVINQWLAFTLAIGAFVSCSEERNEPSSTAEGSGETVTLSLSAEVSVDDADLRAINYKLGTNAKGQLVPLPEFRDGQEVEVHTILKSSRAGSVPVAKTLKWRYNATSKKLVLRPEDGHSITVSGFNNDGGVKWYISGLIGGTLSGTKVTFAGTRELQGTTSAGDAVGSLEVPYAFPWTELTINTTDPNNTRESNGSYKYAQVPSTANLKFAPQGSLIAYKLGNKQKAGAYTFTPTGFTVSTNAFGDQGTFELNTALPSNSTPTVLPAWTEGTPSALVYSFASGQEPGTLEHEAVASKTYYAWVMPHKAQPAAVTTRVMIKGESSRPETEGFKDYTKTWFTDYQVKASQLTQGRVHQLSANATHTYLLPIEYVTDYNLAGGEGLTTVIEPGTRYYQLNGPALGGVQPIGVTGPLRFANYNADGSENDHGHRNDMSGYYNWYKAVGRHHATFNPQTKNLQTEVDATFGADKYYVPSQEQWWGIYPSNTSMPWAGSQILDRDEYMAFGPDPDNLIRQSYRSDWSKGFSTDNYTQDAYVYAIRFKSRPVVQAITITQAYDITTNKNKSYTYPSASDNSLKCAYRYRRVGGHRDWESAITNNRNANLTNQMIMDVVYLGEEAVPTTLAQISDNAWWSAREAEGMVISKTFPASGVTNDTQGQLVNRGVDGPFLSTTLYNADNVWSSSLVPLYFHGWGSVPNSRGVSVRLFARRNH